MIYYIGISVLAVLCAPLIGGLLQCIDILLSKRLQSKSGGLFLQPFYNILKLFGKKTSKSKINIYYLYLSLVCLIISLVLLITGGNLLFVMLTLILSEVVIILSALRINSPYSRMGGQREILGLIASIPVLLMMCVGILILNKSILIKDILSVRSILIYKLPLIFIGILFIVTIIIKNSSDIFNDKLINGGIYSNFSGRELSFLQLIKWYKLIIYLGIMTLFFISSFWLSAVLVLSLYILVIIIHNITPAISIKMMIRTSWGILFAAEIVNIVWIIY